MSAHSSPLQRLQELAQLEREDIITLVIYGAGIGLMSLATPIVVQALVNTIAFGALFQPLVVLTLILFALMAFSNTLSAWQFYVAEMLQRRLFVRLFGAAVHRVQQAQYSVHDKVYLPELSNRFFDVVTLQKTAAVLLLETLGYVLQTLIGMTLLAFYHPLLLAFDLFLIGMLALILFVMGKHGVDTAIEQSKAKYAAAAWLENIAENGFLGRSAHAQAFFQQHTEHLANDYLEACARHFRILARQNIGALALHAVANTLLLGLGGWMVIDRQLSLGQLIAAELVVNAMIYGLTRLGKTLDNFYELLTSVDKISHLLDLPQDVDAGSSLIEGKGPCRIDINHVSIAHSPHLDHIHNIDLSIQAGERLAISTGAERGTLLEILFGLRAPSKGFINLDNHDLRDLNLGILRDQIALVREPEIMFTSIAENLRMGRDIDLNVIRDVLDKVGLLNSIAALPQRLDTELNLNGLPLSQEQCLRLTLARAMLLNPRLLMLDHVLDRIDQRHQAHLMKHLLAKDAPWTLIITSQQPDIIAACSRHIRIEQGRVVNVNPGMEA